MGADSNTCATARAVLGPTQQSGALAVPNPLEEVVTPLRRSQFEAELKDHPDPAWVSDLLHSIDEGVQLGYTGPRSKQVARNLRSAWQHPQIIDKEIDKETQMKRLLGPYDEQT